MRQRIERALARYLERRGWIVVWLDEPVRFCAVDSGVDVFRPGPHQGCWLALYEQHRKATP